MSIYCFRQARSAYNTEFGESAVGDKCHQMRFISGVPTKIPQELFYLGPNSSFYEGGISTHSRFWCVQKYNKDKMEKLTIDFFVLANRKYYFVRNLGIYQRKNAGNIDINHRSK